jgi:hypothetical protein
MIRFSILIAVLLTAGLTADDMEVYKESSDRYFQEQVERLNGGSLREKIIAVENLRRIKSKRALRPLIFALKGTSTYGEAKKGVVQPENSEIDQPLVNVDLPQNNEPALKFLASQAIADIGSERGMSALVEVYNVLEKKIPENEKVNLPKIEEMNNVNAAGEILRSIGKLIERLENTQEIEGLKYRPSAEAVKSGIETLKSALTHKHYYLRSTAADGFRNTNRSEVLEILISSLANEKDDYVKASILSAIVNLKPSDSEKLFDLAELIKSDRPDVRIRVSIGLGSSDIVNAALYLRHAMQFEENFSVRNQMKKDLQTLNSFKTVDVSTAGAYKDLNNGNNSPSSVQAKPFRK